MKTTILAALFASAALSLPVAAWAGESRVYVGAEVAGGHQYDGLFRLSGGDARAPIFALRHDSGQITIAFDDVPVDTADLGHGQHIALGYTQGNVQLWNRTRRFAVAAGQTLYFLHDSYAAAFGTRDIATRSAGAAFGLLAAMPAGARTTVTASVILTPSMHSRTVEWLGNGGNSATQFGKGSMTDLMLAAENRFSGRTELGYGLRYLNYAGGNPSPASGAGAAKVRTAALGAFVAFGFRLQ